MVILVIYSLKDTSWTSAPFGLPEIISLLFVTIIHLWKNNPLISIFGGTILYMIFVQTGILKTLFWNVTIKVQSQNPFSQWKRLLQKLKVGERIPKRQKLLNEIHKIFDENINNDNYRANRILIALRRKGIKKGDKLEILYFESVSFELWHWLIAIILKWKKCFFILHNTNHQHNLGRLFATIQYWLYRKRFRRQW